MKPPPVASRSPRQRRLIADYEAVRVELVGHPSIRVEAIGGMPPEHYRVTYHLRGVRLEGDQPVVADEHVVEFRLPLGYPREQPLVTPQTELFHPNVANIYCVADYWSAGQPLTDFIRKVGDMIQYRVYNLGSPLNPVAARWTAKNLELFPIGHVDLGSPNLEIEIEIRVGGDAASHTPDPPAAPGPGV